MCRPPSITLTLALTLTLTLTLTRTLTLTTLVGIMPEGLHARSFNETEPLPVIDLPLIAHIIDTALNRRWTLTLTLIAGVYSDSESQGHRYETLNLQFGYG